MTTSATKHETLVDVRQLLEARLWVARLGESDTNRWWRTDGILGPDGAFVGPRVLPKTHGTGRARIAFAVARHASDERHPDPKAHHLFRLDPETEDRLDQHLVDSLDDFDFWAAILAKLEKLDRESNLEAELKDAGVAMSEDLGYVEKRSFGPDDRSLPLEIGSSPDQTIRRLVAGFTRSKPGELTVPYIINNGSAP